MLIIAGILTIEPDHRDRMLEAVKPMVDASRAEEGCHEYVFTPDPNDPSMVRLFEQWESEEALATHFQSEHMARWRAAGADLPITSREIIQYTVTDSKPLA